MHGEGADTGGRFRSPKHLRDFARPRARATALVIDGRGKPAWPYVRTDTPTGRVHARRRYRGRAPGTVADVFNRSDGGDGWRGIGRLEQSIGTARIDAHRRGARQQTRQAVRCRQQHRRQHGGGEDPMIAARRASDRRAPIGRGVLMRMAIVCRCRMATEMVPRRCGGLAMLMHRTRPRAQVAFVAQRAPGRRTDEREDQHDDPPEVASGPNAEPVAPPPRHTAEPSGAVD
jgi:hypothetical protein